MSNPLFNLVGNAMPNNEMAQMIQQFQYFKQQFSGNPKDILMNMVSSGKISQAQLNQAQQMAQQYRDILK